MKKHYLLLILIVHLACINSTLASETTHTYFNATCGEIKSVSAGGGAISTLINGDTGALNGSLTPAFLITTNSRDTKTLTLSATANTQGGNLNSIFNVGGVRYIILTNSTVLPQASAITNINGGSPVGNQNSNAIAYTINDPAAISGKLAVAYSATNKNWLLTLTNRGQTTTSITIPAGTPMTNTYSADDEAGAYQATITLSFI